MRAVMLIVPLLIVVPSALEAGQAHGLAQAEGHRIAVIDTDSREWQGKLLKVSADALTIESETGVRQIALGNVRRVDAEGDSLRDGVIKGVLFGLVIGSISGSYAGGERVGMMIAGMSVYGLLGLGLDALNNCKHTVYRAPAPQMTVTLRW